MRGNPNNKTGNLCFVFFLCRGRLQWLNCGGIRGKMGQQELLTASVIAASRRACEAALFCLGMLMLYA